MLDYTLRDVLTRVGGVDRCVSEFIRITDMLLPKRVFTRIVPELLQGGRTPAGVLVRPQLLGSDPACLADNAASLAELNPDGIDLNFGCPAKTVNNHRGGAILLEEPELLHEIAQTVRRAVPAHLPVSAKMRLGFKDSSRAVECAQALASGGISELVVHARTKVDGYRPPAYWDQIRGIVQAVSIPVVANGEIWTVQDARRCISESGCQDLMLGRGIVANPGLALEVAAAFAQGDNPSAEEVADSARARVPWLHIAPLLGVYWDLVGTHVAPRHRAGRLKQWLNLLRRRYPEAEDAFVQLRTLNEPAAVAAWLRAHSAYAVPGEGGRPLA